MKNNLATSIVEFFYVKNWADSKSGSKIQPPSIGDFVLAKKEDIFEVARYCSILERHGILIRMGLKENSITGASYMSVQWNKKDEIYNSYDYLCGGFTKIRDTFKNSVYPVIATRSNDSLDIGTSFLIFTIKGLFVVTALHCLEGMKNIQINDGAALPFIPDAIYTSLNPYIDIVLLKARGTFADTKPLFIGECKVLDDILTMGYPPIPGFDAFLTSELATVNSMIRSSKGKVVGEKNSYLDKLDYILLNARVKGGNSGGPIINNMGYVCGLIVAIPTDSENKDKLDELGYGIGLPTIEIAKIISDIGVVGGMTKQLDFTINKDGFALKKGQ